jgi:hypothetical protein
LVLIPSLPAKEKGRRPDLVRRSAHFLISVIYLLVLVSVPIVSVPIAIEVEKVKQVSDRWAIQRNVRIVVVHYRIWEIIPAPPR